MSALVCVKLGVSLTFTGAGLESALSSGEDKIVIRNMPLKGVYKNL